MGGYEPLRSHPFFETVSWGDLHLQTPPKLNAYLPAMSEDDEDCYGNVSTTDAQTTIYLICTGYHELGEDTFLTTLLLLPIGK